MYSSSGDWFCADLLLIHALLLLQPCSFTHCFTSCKQYKNSDMRCSTICRHVVWRHNTWCDVISVIQCSTLSDGEFRSSVHVKERQTGRPEMYVRAATTSGGWATLYVWCYERWGVVWEWSLFYNFHTKKYQNWLMKISIFLISTQFSNNFHIYYSILINNSAQGT